MKMDACAWAQSSFFLRELFCSENFLHSSILPQHILYPYPSSCSNRPILTWPHPEIFHRRRLTHQRIDTSKLPPCPALSSGQSSG